MLWVVIVEGLSERRGEEGRGEERSRNSSGVFWSSLLLV
jgi:hypothetical protein